MESLYSSNQSLQGEKNPLHKLKTHYHLYNISVIAPSSILQMGLQMWVHPFMLTKNRSIDPSGLSCLCVQASGQKTVSRLTLALVDV